LIAVTRNVAAACLLFLVLAASAAAAGAGAGPLAWPKDAGTSVVSIPVHTNQFAVTAIELDSHAVLPHRVVLLGVRPQHAKDARGLRMRYAATTGRGMQIGGEHGWRPAAWDLRPIRTVIPPHTRFAVVVGAAAKKRGIHLLRGFIVDYRYRGKRYHAPQEQELEVCASVSSCP
jgi:hypothetical protein